jgi:hypothetical protein
MPFEYKIDKKAAESFSNYANGKTAPMTFINSFDNGKQCLLTKVMTPLSSIIKNEFGYSIYVLLDPVTAEELQKYDSLGQRIVPNGISFKSLLIDNEKLYLKLKVVDDKFTSLSFANPAEFDQVDLQGQNLEVTFNLGVWVNFEKSCAGSFLKIVSITKV